jgi:hypothetical protein
MPQYSGNIAKVGIKHQPINQWDTIVEIVPLNTYKMAWRLSRQFQTKR